MPYNPAGPPRMRGRLGALVRCRQCDYRLWNLTSRSCPECGSAFRPSEYEFTPNAVQFCCPQCRQAYYGTGPKGHLQPIEFECARCGPGLHMDDMVLLPTAGVEEIQTSAEPAPWLQRRTHGWLRSWISTVGQSMVKPQRLIDTISPQSSIGEALSFAVITTLLIVAPSLILFLVLPMMFASGRAGFLVTMLLVVGMTMVIVTLGFCLLLLITSLIVHGLLFVTGGTAHGLRRTFHAVCYSSGANVLTAIPCVGIYFGWIWWVVSGAIMVQRAQGVHPVRAGFAVVALPLLLMVGFVSLALVGMTLPMTAMTAMQAQTGETGVVLRALQDHAEQHGRGPAHGLQLVIGQLGSSDLVTADSATDPDNVPLADTTLGQFEFLTGEQRQQTVQALVEDLPAGVIAHRVGDFVFCHHGVPMDTTDGLWLVILFPDPAANPPPNPAAIISVGTNAGKVETFTHGMMAARLRAQNQLRRTFNLPPLPDPGTVTHDRPGR